ncbi:hypothetical protein [Compostimonas suwonensis]|uniref:hypothetical protein n=1 Tax=Compostimonas suwonensis TaxID=1048394 RepID=UPI001B800235|nr:hypothetical protein [Compostimonas suwonensis]
MERLGHPEAVALLAGPARWVDGQAIFANAADRLRRAQDSGRIRAGADVLVLRRDTIKTHRAIFSFVLEVPEADAFTCLADLLPGAARLG